MISLHKYTFGERRESTQSTTKKRKNIAPTL